MADITREQIVFELQAEVAAAQAKVERFSAAIDKAKVEGRKVGANLKQGLAGAQAQLSQTTKAMNQYSVASKKAAGSSTFLYQQLGYLASDARYGLMGVANNLSIVAVGLQNMAIRAKEDGETFFSAFKKGLFGAGGILLGIQIFIALLPEMLAWFKKTNDESKKFSNLVNVQSVKLEVLKNRLNKVNLSLAERSRILKQAESLGANVKGPDGKWLENLEEINRQIDIGISKIKKRAEAAALEQELVAAYKEKYNGPGFFVKLWSHIRIAGVSWQSALRMFSGLPPLPEEAVVEWKRWESGVDKRIKSLTEKLSKIGTDLDSGSSGGSSALFNFMKTFTSEQELEGKGPFEKLAIQLNNAVKKAIELGAEEGGPEQKLIESVFRKRGTALLKSLGIQADVFQSGFETDEEAKINAKEAESLDKLQQFYDHGLFNLEEFEKRKTEIEKYYSEQRKNIDQAESDSKWANAQKGLQIVSNVLDQGARLGEKNKGLAKAAVITNAAAASIGIWRDYHGEKNTIPTPFNTIAAGLTQTALIFSTVKALQSINNSGSGGGASSGASRPSFNIIGQNGNNALQATIQEQTGVLQEGKNDNRVVLVTSDLEIKQNDNRVAVETATL